MHSFLIKKLMPGSGVYLRNLQSQVWHFKYQREFYLTNEETKAQNIKLLVPKHTSQLVAKQQPAPRVCARSLMPSFCLQNPRRGPMRRASCLWARPHGAPPDQNTKKGLCFISCSGSQHLMHNYSNVSFNPDIEMLLKNYMQTPRENTFTSNQRGLGSCHKRQYRQNRPRTSLSAE